MSLTAEQIEARKRGDSAEAGGMTTSRTFTVVVHAEGAISFFEGERIADRLSWDEALGEFARLTYGPQALKARYWEDADHYVARMERWSDRARERLEAADAFETELLAAG